MSTEKNLSAPPTFVLGGGIGGLTAAYALLKAGKKVILIEKSAELGGLMRAVRHDGFCVDLGQKQIYSRIPAVNEFLDNLLGKDLRKYDFRVGVWYKNAIYERDRAHKGILRGMPATLIAWGLGDMALQKLRYLWKSKKSLEDLSYAQKGKLFSQIFSQGFDEKLKCRPWSAVPAVTGTGNGKWHAAQKGANGAGRLLDRGLSGQAEWRHPALGSGGLIAALKQGILDMGGTIRMQTEIAAICRDGRKIAGVELRSEKGPETMPAHEIVCAMRLDVLAKLLGIPGARPVNAPSFRRGCVLVYLFLDAPPKFPHTCLYVTQSGYRVARITNYAAYGCAMVPPGKSCLAFELFALQDDPLFRMPDREIFGIVREEFKHANLLDFNRLSHRKIIRLPMGDAGTNWEDYKSEPARQRLYEEVSQFQNLYYVSRTGVDKTMHAALAAADAIGESRKEKFLAATAPQVKAPWKAG